MTDRLKTPTRLVSPLGPRSRGTSATSAKGASLTQLPPLPNALPHNSLAYSPYSPASTKRSDSEKENDFEEEEIIEEDERLESDTTTAAGTGSSPKKGAAADTKQGEDPLRILKPGRKKLGSLEAERIIAVLDASILKLSLVPCISHTNARLERLMPDLPRDFVALLDTHHELEREYELCEVPDEKDDFGRALENSTRDVLRYIQKASSASSLTSLSAVLLAAAPQPADPNAAALIEGMKTLRQATHGKLLTTLEEVRVQQDYVTKLLDTHRSQTSQIERLEEELVKAYEERDKEIEMRDAILSKLQAELEHIVVESSEAIKAVDRDARRKEEKEREERNGRVGEVQVTVESLTKDLQALKVSHKESEAALRKKRFKQEAEIQTWIAKFDAEMSDKQQAIDEVAAQFAEEERQLAELQGKYELIEVEYNTIMEEKRIQREKQRLAEIEMQKMIKAAVLLQNVWRAFRARKALKQAQEKKSKPKGKKKK